MSHPETSRRHFTVLAGGVVVAGLAGCTTTGGGNTSTTPAGNESSTSGTNATSTTSTTTGAPQTTSNPASTVANGNAAVRVAHLSPDAPNVDVLVDGQQVLSRVAFGSVSPYLVLAPGSYHVQVTPAGNHSQTVFDSDVSVDAKAYTAAALGEVSGQNHPFGVTIFVDDVTPPSSDTASVRLVHAAPDAPAVDVTVKGANLTLFDNVSFGQASDYASAPAGAHTLEVRAHAPNNDGQVVKTADVTLSGGTVDTAFAMGYLSPSKGPANEPFRLTLTTDSSASG